MPAREILIIEKNTKHVTRSKIYSEIISEKKRDFKNATNVLKKKEETHLHFRTTFAYVI